MPIKILVKKKVVSSNETQTLPEKPKTAPAPKSAVASKLTPFIDKISIVADVPAKHAADIHKNLMAQIDDTLVFKPGPKWGKFKVGKRIALDQLLNSKKWPVFQYQHENNLATKLRVEFSPEDLGLLFLDKLHEVLTPILPGGWLFFIQHGRVTGIEVSVDVPKIDVNHFHVLPQQVTTAMTWGTDGKFQTLVLGKPQGNQTRIYNRGAKRKAKGQTGEVVRFV